MQYDAFDNLARLIQLNIENNPMQSSTLMREIVEFEMGMELRCRVAEARPVSDPLETYAGSFGVTAGSETDHDLTQSVVSILGDGADRPSRGKFRARGVDIIDIQITKPIIRSWRRVRGQCPRALAPDATQYGATNSPHQAPLCGRHRRLRQNSAYRCE
jgi:hypothetical protein